MRPKRHPGVVAGLAADLICLSMVDAPGSGFAPNSAVACLGFELEARPFTDIELVRQHGDPVSTKMRTTPEIKATGLVGLRPLYNTLKVHHKRYKLTVADWSQPYVTRVYCQATLDGLFKNGQIGVASTGWASVPSMPFAATLGHRSSTRSGREAGPRTALGSSHPFRGSRHGAPQSRRSRRLRGASGLPP